MEKYCRTRFVPALLFAFALVFGSITTPANAGVYTFNQSGWFNVANGAPVVGTLSFTFTGFDLGGTGYIQGGAAIGGNGVTEFSLSWSGNSLIPAFSTLFNIIDPLLAGNLVALAYHVGDPDFSDDMALIISPRYSGGGGPNGNINCDRSTIVCGTINDGNGAFLSSFSAPSQIPEPGTLALFAVSTLGFLASRRGRPTRRAER